MQGWIWLLIGIFILILVMGHHINKNEGFDPSVRVGAGWVAGPQWGNGKDPVTLYAEQIEAAKQGRFDVV